MVGRGRVVLLVVELRVRNADHVTIVSPFVTPGAMCVAGLRQP
jgi:hypothetical protein